MANTIPINDRIGDGGPTSIAVYSHDSSGNVTGLVGPDGIISYPIILAQGANIVRTADGTAGDATYATLATVTVPGGLLGSNGRIDVMIQGQCSASTPDKPLVINLDGQAMSAPTILAANTRWGGLFQYSMAGSTSSIESLNIGFNPLSQGVGAIITKSIDMTLDKDLTITMAWTAAATAGNTFRILHYTVVAYPGG